MIMFDSAARRTEHGFTLIEVIVGLMISTLIVVLLSTGLRLVAAGWTRGINAANRKDMFERAFGIITTDFAKAQRIVWSGRDGMRFAFQAASGELHFFIEEPPYPTASRLFAVHYYVRPLGGGFALYRARTPYDPDITSFEAMKYQDAVVLLEGDFSYRFFFRAMGRRGVAWKPQWTTSKAFPDQLRIDVIDNKRATFAVPSFIATMRINAEPDCINVKARKCTISTGGLLAGPS